MPVRSAIAFLLMATAAFGAEPFPGNGEYWWLEPPERFESGPSVFGKPVVYYLSQEAINRTCRNEPNTALRGGIPYDACTAVGRGPNNEKQCLILIRDTATGVFKEALYRHEMAHCRGWSAAHEK